MRRMCRIWLAALLFSAAASITAAEERQFDMVGLDFYPAPAPSCGEAAQSLLINLAGGAAEVHAKNDAGGALSIRLGPASLAFMLGHQGCRVGVIVGIGDAADIPREPSSGWTPVQSGVDGETFAKAFHSASPACEKVQVQIGVQRGSTQLGMIRLPRPVQAAGQYEDAVWLPDSLRFTVGRGDCAIRVLTFKAD